MNPPLYLLYYFILFEIGNRSARKILSRQYHTTLTRRVNSLGRHDGKNITSRSVQRSLSDIFRFVIEIGPMPRWRRCPWHRYIERRDTGWFPLVHIRTLSPRALRRWFRESDAPPWSSGRRGRWCHQRWRRGCGHRIGRWVIWAFQVVVYTWVWVLLCTWSPSVFPIAFAGA